MTLVILTGSPPPHLTELSPVPAAYQAVLQNPTQGYQGVVGVQQPQNQNLVSSQHSNMGSQMQGVMVPYPPLPYQVSTARHVSVWGGCTI